MKTPFTFFLFLIVAESFSQHPILDESFGNLGLFLFPGMTEINCVDFDPDGNIINVGYTLHEGGVYRLTLAKTDQDGVPDDNFGINGIVTVSIDYSEWPLSMSIQPDGRILIAGFLYLGPTTTGPGDYQGFAARYNNDGSPDTSFAESGVFRFSVPDTHFASVNLLPDNSVILGGNIGEEGMLIKLTPEGVMDSQFGTNGILWLSSANFNFIFWNSILLNDNSVLCVGYDATSMPNTKMAYCKIDESGNFVENFAQNGKAVVDTSPSPYVTEYLSVAKEFPDGRILLGGYNESNVLIRVHPDGAPDNAFGTSGVVEHGYSFKDFEIQQDGKVLIGGSKQVADYNYGYSLSRLDQAGNPDPGFNGTGFFDLDLSAGNDFLQDIKFQGPDKLILAGASGINPETNFTLVRIDLSGTLHTEDFFAGVDITVYPNPFHDKVFVSDRQELIQDVKIFDNSGRLLKIIRNFNASEPISIDHPNGVYHLMIGTKNGEVIHRKIIKK